MADEDVSGGRSRLAESSPNMARQADPLRILTMVMPRDRGTRHRLGPPRAHLGPARAPLPPRPRDAGAPGVDQPERRPPPAPDRRRLGVKRSASATFSSAFGAAATGFGTPVPVASARSPRACRRISAAHRSPDRQLGVAHQACSLDHPQIGDVGLERPTTAATAASA